MPTQRFPAKVDFAVAMLLSSMATIFIGIGLASMLLANASVFGGVMLILTGAMLLWIWRGTFYQITDKYVVMRSGPIRWRIPLRKITEARITANGWLLVGGSYLRLALSADAIMIQYQGKWFGLIEPAALISPKDREAFLHRLVEGCPDLELAAAGKVMRRPSAQ